MACRCKLKERRPLGPAIDGEGGVLTRAELTDMRFRKGSKPIRIGV